MEIQHIDEYSIGHERYHGNLAGRPSWEYKHIAQLSNESKPSKPKITVMDRAIAKEKIKYVDKLDVEPRTRYLDKLKLLNGFDPYESAENEWSTDYKNLPPLEFPGIVSYLVCGVSAYTLEQFKSYKSLEAHMQFTDGWVQEVKLHVPVNCENTVVKSKVLHSQRLGERPLRPWVILSRSGQVEAAHCDCMAGIAESCTHVGALLFKMEALIRVRERTTVTGVPSYWIVPSGVDKVNPLPGHKIDFSSASAKKKKLDKAIETGEVPSNIRTCLVNRRFTTTPEPTEEQQRAFMDALHATGTKSVLLSAEPKFCTEFKDPIEPVIIPRSLLQLRNCNFDKAGAQVLSSHCESIFDKMQVTAEEAKKIERVTRDQHKSPSWFACRAGRITASSLHKVLTFNYDKPAVSTVSQVCYPACRKNNMPATTWGIDHEEEAKHMYVNALRGEHCLLSVEKAGFFINPDTPFMGASPDGIVSCECCGRGTLEIKCPYKHRHNMISVACEDRDFCLIPEGNGAYKIKKSHAYYTQIQCQMAVCEVAYCDFFVWTTVDSAVVRIESDAQFVDSIKAKAKFFFCNVVLPELVAKTFTANRSEKVNKRPLGESGLDDSEATNSRATGSRRKKTKRHWCYCKEPEGTDDMVACDNRSCQIEWFHISCVGLEHLPGADDTWFCHSCLKMKGKEN